MAIPPTLRQPTPLLQTLSEVYDTFQTLSSMEITIKECPPQVQLEQTSELFIQKKQLEAYRQTVEAVYNSHQPLQPALSQEEVQLFYEMLKTSSTVLHSMEENLVIAQRILELQAEAREIIRERSINPNVIGSLHERLTEVAETNGINLGNLIAIRDLQGDLPHYPQPVRPLSPFQRSVILESRANAPREQQPNRSDLGSQLRAQQDEQFKIVEARDKFMQLFQSLKDSPEKNLEAVLNFCNSTSVKNDLQKTVFLALENKQLTDQLIQDIKVCMDMIIQEQVTLESSPTQKRKREPEGQNDLAPLMSFEEFLSNVIKEEINKPNANIMEINKGVEARFSTLSPEQKEKLFNSLSALLLTEGTTKRPLPVALRGQAFQIWPGSLQLKLRALAGILPKGNSPAAAPAQDSPKLSDKMRQQVRAAMQVPVVTPPVMNSNSEMIALQVSAIGRLHKLLPLLRDEASFHELGQCLEVLVFMESAQSKAVFPISGNDLRLIADRPNFHLYFIHKNEHSGPLPEDASYGHNAMIGMYLTDNSERRRAIQRTILELSMVVLQTCKDRATCEDVVKLVANLGMDLRDVPREFSSLDWGSLENFQLNLGVVTSVMQHQWKLG